jgi:WD40 repeat protein
VRSLAGAQRITWAAWSPDGKTIAATGRQLQQDPSKAGVVAEWDASTGRPLGPPITIAVGEPVTVAFAPSGTTVAISGVNGFVQILDPARRTVQSRISPPGGSWTLGVAFSPDGSTLASTDWNGSLDLWDARTGKMLGAPIPDPSQAVTNSVAWSPDGRTIALTDWSNALRLFDVATRKEIGPPFQLEPANGPNAFPYATFTPDGSKVVVTDTTGRVWLFPASLKAWEDAACRVANRNFTRAEWQQLVSGRSYSKVCP